MRSRQFVQRVHWTQLQGVIRTQLRSVFDGAMLLAAPILGMLAPHAPVLADLVPWM